MDYPHAKEWPKDQSLKFWCRAASKCFLWTTYWLYNYEYRCFRKNYYFIPCNAVFWFLVFFCFVDFVLYYLSPVTSRREWKSGRESGRIWLNVGWKELQGRSFALERTPSICGQHFSPHYWGKSKTKMQFDPNHLYSYSLIMYYN